MGILMQVCKNMMKSFFEIVLLYMWSWNLYKCKNDYIQTFYTHKVVKVVSENFFVNKFSDVV